MHFFISKCSDFLAGIYGKKKKVPQSLEIMYMLFLHGFDRITDF